MAYKKLLIFFIILFSYGIASEGYVEPWGKEANIHYQMVKSPNSKIENQFLYDIAQALINFHQKVISPSDGPRSHFYPVSSKYMRMAINKYGLLKGYLKGCDRLIRENNDPWVYDTVIIGNKKIKSDLP